MSARKNLRRTANEQRLYATQHIGCVKLPGPYWNTKRIASVGVLAIFCAILCAGVSSVEFSPKLSKQAVQPSSEPYEIVLSGSADDGDASDVTAAEQAPRNEKRPAFEVTVDGEDAGEGADELAEAVREVAAARAYLRQGNVRQAIVFQHRAVEHAPDNMAYRLQLAVLHDRLNDAKGALMLYRQVVDAYENKDTTLPSKLDIEHIKNRLDYLASKADR